MKNPSGINKGYLLALIAGASWGAMGIFVKNLNNLGLDSMTISSFRPTIAVIFYLIINLIKNPECFKTDLKGLILFAIYGVFALDGMFIASSYAVKYTGVATASVLLFINPIIVVVLSYFIFKEKFTVKKLIALVLAITGCCLVVKVYDSNAFKLNLIGIIWGVASGVSVALQNILGKIALKRYSCKTHLIYSFIFGTIFLWFFKSPVALVKAVNSTSVLVNVIGLGLISTLIPNGAIVKALEYIESGKASIVASVEPVVASILAFVIFGERFQFLQLTGVALIMSSIVLIQMKDRMEIEEKEKVESVEETLENKALENEILGNEILENADEVKKKIVFSKKGYNNMA